MLNLVDRAALRRAAQIIENLPEHIEYEAAVRDMTPAEVAKDAGVTIPVALNAVENAPSYKNLVALMRWLARPDRGN